MKKYLSLILVAFMLVGMLAACGGNDSGVTTTETGATEAGVTEAEAAVLTTNAESALKRNAVQDLGLDTKYKGGVLKVAMECAYAPYNWSQADDTYGAVRIADSGNFAYGYDVMMAKYLAAALGAEVEIHKMEWDSIPTAVQAGTVDCAICGMSVTADRLETVDFTNPYYYATIVCVVNADGAYANAAKLADLDGAKATSQLNTIWYDKCVDQIPNVGKQTAMEDVPAMFTALTSGAVDVVVCDQPTALAAVTANPSLKLLDFSGSDDDFEVSEEDVNIGIAVTKGNDELTEALNTALATLTKDDYTAWMEDAIAVQPMNE